MSQPEIEHDEASWNSAPAEDHGPELPYSIEAEQALLGALLVNEHVYDRISGLVRKEHFYEPLHGRIFAAIEKMVEQGRVATPVTITSYFDNDPAIKEIGGPKYLARLAFAATTLISAPDYARAISEHALRRSIILAAQDMQEAAYDVEVIAKPEALLSDAEEILSDVRRSFAGELASDPIRISEAAVQTFQRIDEIEKRGKATAGISTGLAALDSRIGGLEKKNFNLLAGRPGMGKTLAATEIALNAARAGHGVLFVSLEMPAREIAARALSSIVTDLTDAPIAYSDILKGRIDFEHRERLERARDELEGLPFFVVDRMQRKVPAIASQIRQKRRELARLGEPPIELLIIDHIGHLHGRQNHRGNRNSELTEISGDLLELSMDGDLSVLALSQLSRDVERRDDKRPRPDDLRDSGSLEQDAHVIMFMYREEHYLRRETPAEGKKAAWDAWNEKLADAINVAEIITAKQRNGPTGTDRFYCDLKTNRLRGLAR